MASEKTRYDEITKARISDARNVVISNCSKGGYTIAQQMIARDGKSEVAVFMKGAIHVKDVEALCKIRDALNVVISEAEEHPAKSEDGWDEEE